MPTHLQAKVGVAILIRCTFPNELIKVFLFTVALNEGVHRLGNGSIQLDWHLPRELRDSRELVIEINLNGEWIPVRYDGSTPHIQAHLDKHFEHRVQFRLRLGKWVGFGDITIPAAPLSLSPTTSTSSDETVTSDDDLSDRKLFQLNEVGLIYGLIFGLLVVACSVVVITILVLKYIQMTRRDSDKGQSCCNLYSGPGH